MYIKQLAGEDKHRIFHICGTRGRHNEERYQEPAAQERRDIDGSGVPRVHRRPQQDRLHAWRAHDASKKFDIKVETSYNMPAGCKCGEVLRAMIYSWDYPRFNKGCDPDNPIGPCMVSHEGSCFIAARYGVEKL